MFYKLLVGISPNLQLWYSWGHKMNLLDFEIRRSRSQQDQIWSYKNFGRHFVTGLWNSWIMCKWVTTWSMLDYMSVTTL